MIKKNRMYKVIYCVVAAMFASSAGVVTAQETLDRTILPIAEPKPQTYKELDARKAKAPARFDVKPPKGAPNVVIVLIDDIGFGWSKYLWWSHPYTYAGFTGRSRFAFKQLSYDLAMFANAQCAEDWSQSSHDQHWLDYGDRDCISR